MPHLAWFSPVRPVKSGISQYNHELLTRLAAGHVIDLFVDGPPDQFVSPDVRVRLLSAHDFLWRHSREPYDLIVYQLGNAPCHDYMWAYLVRHPGLVVLHDGQLHHARGRMLLQQVRPRRDDYRQEFWYNHPDADPDLAELGAAGLLGSLTYLWPMLRIVVESSRCVVVHNAWLAEHLRETHPGAAVAVIEMGVPDPAPHTAARPQMRSRWSIPEDAVVFMAFGKATPEKRIREAICAIASIAEAIPRARLLIAGETVDYYDLRAEAEALGVSERVTITGYLDDEEIDDCLAASDVCLCMRWPTSRETSASWLRCLAAGKPTIVTDLVHTVDIPALDPRNWSVLAGLKGSTTTGAGGTPPDGGDTPGEARPVGVSIDILDEVHSLKLAIRRLATDDALRAALGSNARALWSDRFRIEGMAAAYEAVIMRLLRTGLSAAEIGTLPLHLRATGAEHADSLVSEFLGPEYHLRDAD
jgi:glycosyltransferase involved in cell wall biosynthesis